MGRKQSESESVERRKKRAASLERRKPCGKKQTVSAEGRKPGVKCEKDLPFCHVQIKEVR